MQLISVHDILCSIAYDIDDMRNIIEYMENHGTVFGNKRTGNWYYCKKSVYFKSSDGHYGKWEFSWKRMNLDLLSALSIGNTMIIDATKKGKIHSDAFTKTIPIWICLVNKLLNHQNSSSVLNHLTPSEADEIKKLVEKEIQNIHLHPCFPLLMGSVDQYKLKNNKQIVLILLRNSNLVAVKERLKISEYSYIFLLSAGDDHHGRRMLRDHGFEYVKGAGDDTELFIPKYVTPRGLHQLIALKDVPNYQRLSSSRTESQLVQVSQYMYIANLPSCISNVVSLQEYLITFNCARTPLKLKNEFILDLEPGKKGLKKFGDSLKLVCDTVLQHPNQKILFVDEDLEKPAAFCILMLLIQRHVSDKRVILLLYQELREKSDELSIRRCFLNKASQYYFNCVAAEPLNIQN